MPVTRDELVRWLADLGIEDADSGGSFRYDDSIDLTIDVSEDGAALLLAADIGEFDPAPPAETLRLLLRANHLGLGPGRASLSLAPDDTTITLWRAVPLAAIDSGGLDDLVAGFLATAVDQRQETADMAARSAERQAPMPSNQFRA